MGIGNQIIVSCYDEYGEAAEKDNVQRQKGALKTRLDLHCPGSHQEYKEPSITEGKEPFLIVQTAFLQAV